MITWRPIAELPDELKDGREVLLWNGSIAIIGECFHGGWYDMGIDRRLDPTHFAEITPP